MTREAIEGWFTIAAFLAVAAWALSGCAAVPPQTFTRDGIDFVPVPRAAIEEIAARYHVPYTVDAVAMRPAPIVWYADDNRPSRALIEHEIRHFRRDPASATGWCEHLPDGRTWIHAACK